MFFFSLPPSLSQTLSSSSSFRFTLPPSVALLSPLLTFLPPPSPPPTSSSPSSHPTHSVLPPARQDTGFPQKHFIPYSNHRLHHPRPFSIYNTYTDSDFVGAIFVELQSSSENYVNCVKFSRQRSCCISRGLVLVHNESLIQRFRSVSHRKRCRGASRWSATLDSARSHPDSGG